MMTPGLRILVGALALASGLSGQRPAVDIRFSPRSDAFAAATREYEAIWSAEGVRVIEIMERVSRLKFLESGIRAIVFEGVSQSGLGDTPMMLRASYPADTKKATLIHELGHRHLAQLKLRPRDIDEHRVLFLVLYDMWVELYGEQFAKEQVGVEKQRRGLYDYEAAWNWALSLSREDRRMRFQEVLQQNGRDSRNELLCGEPLRPD